MWRLPIFESESQIMDRLIREREEAEMKTDYRYIVERQGKLFYVVKCSGGSLDYQREYLDGFPSRAEAGAEILRLKKEECDEKVK